MKHFYYLTLLIGISTSSLAQTYQWTQSGGGTDADESYGVTGLANGNVAIAGFISNSATFGSTVITSTGGTDGILACYDGSGNLLFTWQFTGSDSCSGHQVTTDPSGNIIVTGEFAGDVTIGTTTLTSTGGNDIFIAKFDGSGNFSWAVKAGGTLDEEVNAIRTDGSGNIYFNGFFEGTSLFGPSSVTSAGDRDAFVSKLNPAGSFQWTTSCGGINEDESHALAVTSAGDIYLGGFFNGTATFGLSTFTSNNNSRDIFFAYLSTNGYFQWAMKAGSAENDGAIDAISDASGSGYVVGYFRSSVIFGGNVLVSTGNDDIFVVKINSAGAYLWAARFGGTGEDKAYGAGIYGTDILVTGSYEASFTAGAVSFSSSGDRDIFMLKLSGTNGTPNDGITFGGPGFDRGYNIAGQGQQIYLTGVFEQTALFNGISYTSQGMSDIFVTKIGFPVGLDEVSANAFSISPNPCGNIINLYVAGGIGSKGTVWINDPAGRPVRSQDLPADGHLQIDLSTLSKGTYLVRVVTENNSYSKLVVRN